jgi:hypothetical protein
MRGIYKLLVRVSFAGTYGTRKRTMTANLTEFPLGLHKKHWFFFLIRNFHLHRVLVYHLLSLHLAFGLVLCFDTINLLIDASDFDYSLSIDTIASTL